MKKIFSLLLVGISSISYSHDIRMAIFEITENDSGLQMNISVDRYYFYESLKNEFEDHATRDFENMAWEYLQSRVAIEVDGNCTAFEITEIEYGEENIYLKGSLNLQLEDIKEVKMTNTCMVDLVEGHDNIMKLKLNDRTRSFRLNSKRTSTIASYND
ncbi:DUF6702 family protein [Ekhidna sp.]